MGWSEIIREQVDALKPVQTNTALVQKLYHLVDLTSLNENDTESSVADFFNDAINPFGHVAAVCVSLRFVRMAATQFADTAVKVATVANFPSGDASIEEVLIEIGRALEDGAQEIDVVFPYQRYLAGERHYAHTFIETCKSACGEHVALKVILETGALKDLAIIAEASFDALMAGADFIKTSTGKIEQGATLEAAATMLLTIKKVQPQLQRTIGLKISGGIRDVATAAQYLELADSIMGMNWASPKTFRIGASRLVQEITTILRRS